MPGLSSGHWWLIAIVLVIVLIIWGPGKLPDVGSGLGRAIREFRKASTETRDEFVKATRSDDAPTPSAATPAPAPAPAPVVPAPVVEPTPVGGGTPVVVPPAEQPAGEGDHTTS